MAHCTQCKHYKNRNIYGFGEYCRTGKAHTIKNVACAKFEMNWLAKIISKVKSASAKK